MGCEWRPQCSGLSSGDMDSNELIPMQPNSLAKMFGCERPVSLWLIWMGMRERHSCPFMSLPPLVAGNPFPCWYGPWVSRVRSFRVCGTSWAPGTGRAVSFSTPEAQPRATRAAAAAGPLSFAAQAP